MIPLTRKAKAIMIQGTSSHCGKSVIAAAFCRIFRNLDYNVAPFKAQNMSLNSYVTASGEEISRAQGLQALACKIEPVKEVNPILIKPKGNMSSQIILLGKPYRDMDAKAYMEFAPKVGVRIAKGAIDKLLSNFDIVVIEGAGSPAEINLYHSDIANMRTSEMAGAPVMLVSDIDRGGSFASIVGTLELLRPEHKKRVKGFILNKFRGDLDILKPGLKLLEEITHKPVLGVVPYIQNLHLPVEDSVSLEEITARHVSSSKVDIAVVWLPRISNFTDFDPLRSESCVEVRFVRYSDELGRPDMVILPGTKNTIRDLMWLRQTGLADAIRKLALLEVPVIGICGGYQILGKLIVDNAVEDGALQSIQGLGLLDVVTRFDNYDKVTSQVEAQLVDSSPVLGEAEGTSFQGYEIHTGITSLGDAAVHLFHILKRNRQKVQDFDGAVDKTGLVLGTYIHGLFDSPIIRRSFIQYLSKLKGVDSVSKPDAGDISNTWDENLEMLARVVEDSVNMEMVYEIMGLKD